MTYKTAYGAAIAAATAVLFVTFGGIRITQALSAAQPGDSDTNVSELQMFLANDSSIYPEGLVTGFYGPLTTLAVERYQCAHDIACSGDWTTTGYGRVGPMTLAEILGTPKIPNTGAPADASAPIMSAPTVIVLSTSAIIQWQTSEPAENAVLYGLSWPFYFGNSLSGWSKTFSTGAAVEVDNLVPGHTYYYVTQSADASGNAQYSGVHTFTTSQ